MEQRCFRSFDWRAARKRVLLPEQSKYSRCQLASRYRSIRMSGTRRPRSRRRVSGLRIEPGGGSRSPRRTSRAREWHRWGPVRPGRNNPPRSCTSGS
eukprot:4409858-Prymnesium_polylepis.1